MTADPPSPTCANPTIRGTEAEDTIRGTSGPDIIDAGDGHDVVYGLGGDDLICGGGNDDRIYAGAGDDVVSGGLGWDTIYGGPGDDVLFGDKRADQITTGDWLDPDQPGEPSEITDHDIVYGGEDADTLVAAGGRAELHEGGPGHGETDQAMYILGPIGDGSVWDLGDGRYVSVGVYLRPSPRASTLLADYAAGTVTFRGATARVEPSMERAFLLPPERGAPVRLQALGSDGPDRISLTGFGGGTVDLGGGDDEVGWSDVGTAGRQFDVDLGDGIDRLYLRGPESLDYHMGTGALLADGERAGTVAGAEEVTADLDLAASTRIEIEGSNGADTVYAVADTVVVRGGEGDDSIHAEELYADPPTSGLGSVTLSGGPGDDTLNAWPSASSILNGGEGNDTLADLGTRGRMSGGPGTDVCSKAGGRPPRGCETITP